MPELVEKIARLESEYDEEISFSKFLKHNGGSYTQDQFIEFLKWRYERINRIDHPDHMKIRYSD